MKLIFLDIDGVLNGYDHFLERHKRSKAGIISLNIPTNPVPQIFDVDEKSRRTFNIFASMIDPKPVELINQLIKKTNSEVVISSTWREMFSIEELKALLGSKGFVGEIIGRTPKLDSEIRGHEIIRWLEQFKDSGNTVESFVVLDDDTDMDKVKEHFVHIASDNGIEQSHVDLSIKLLDNDTTIQLKSSV